MFKKIAIGVGALLVVVAVGLYFLLSNLDGLIKTALEKYGSEATQSQVTVGGVGLSLTDGRGSISALTVGNPKGFVTPSAFSFGEVRVAIDPATVTKDTVVVREVVIDAPQVTYEVGPAGTNLQTIQKNVAAYAAKKGGGSGGQPAQASSGGQEKKLIIENLYVRNGRVGVSHAALQGQALNADLPAIHLRDIGKSRGGATPAEIADQVIGAIGQSASRVAAADLNKTLESLKGSLGGALGGGASGTAGGASGATDQLRNILGR